jgi:hypothetical protein
MKTEILLAEALHLWRNGCDAAADVIDTLLELRIEETNEPR